MEISKKDFEKALAPAVDVAKPGMIPILECVMLESSNDQIRIEATDLKTSIISHCPAQKVEQFKVCVDGQLLYSTIKALPDQVLRISISNKFKVEHASGTFSIAIQPSDQFPYIKDITAKKSITLSAQKIFEIFDRGIRCVSKDDLRPNLSGICIESGDYSALKFTSTDAFSLSHTKSDIELGEQLSRIINPSSCNFLRKNMAGDKFVEVTISDQGIKFVTDYVIVCSWVDSPFPNYQAIIPKNFTTELHLDRQSLLNCLKRVELYSNQTTNSIKLSLKNGILTISANDLDTARDATEALSGAQTGDDIEIGFNSKILTKLVSGIDSDSLYLKFVDPKKPLIIEPEDGEYFFLAMPVILS